MFPPGNTGGRDSPRSGAIPQADESWTTVGRGPRNVSVDPKKFQNVKVSTIQLCLYYFALVFAVVCSAIEVDELRHLIRDSHSNKIVRLKYFTVLQNKDIGPASTGFFAQRRCGVEQQREVLHGVIIVKNKFRLVAMLI